MLASTSGSAAGPSVEDVKAAMRAAAGFMREEVVAKGSYGWWYSADLSVRSGEGEMLPSQGWVQPPGMPAVGTAFLQAFEATHDPYYLDAAQEVADKLVRSQLRSGGWWYMAEFDPEARQAWCYRIEPDCEDQPDAHANRFRNVSQLDDDTTQAALAFLIRTNRALASQVPVAQDPAIADAIDYALGKLLDTQYANGSWPNRLNWRRDDPAQAPPSASFPETWSRTFVRIGSQNLFYSLEDYLIRDTVRTLILAHRVSGKDAYLAAARRAGAFVRMTQMPAPQRGWAQHYDAALQPIWGRKFEPPSIASRETAGSIETLADLFLYTGDHSWLEPIPAAVEWLQRSRLPDGDWARFYELETNQPLYMNSDYELTYSDADMPAHYGFKSQMGILESLERFRQVMAMESQEHEAATSLPAALIACQKVLAPLVDMSVRHLDKQGRWIEGGKIYSDTFIRRMEAMAAYIAAGRGRPLVTGNAQLEAAPDLDMFRAWDAVCADLGR